MPDPDQQAIQAMRAQLRADPRHRVVAHSVDAGDGTAFVEHTQPHIILFKQDCTLVLEFGRRAAGGGFEPTGDSKTFDIKAGTSVVRPAGIWRIKVTAGTAEFEKDFGLPEAPAKDAPIV